MTTGTRGDGGTLFVQGAAAANRQPNADTGLPAVVIAVEHYGRIVRALQKNMPVKIDLEIKNTFHEGDTASFNVVGEIPGTDKADEVVMLGAHFDSWHGVDRRHRQCRRIGRDDGSDADPEAVGPQAAAHGADRAVGRRRAGADRLTRIRQRALRRRHRHGAEAGHAKFSGYFNLDNGTGAIRGVYLQGNEAVAPIFEAWMKPFNNLGMTTLTIRNTGGTDHQSFDGRTAGLPVHPGRRRVRHADAPLEHGRLRAPAGRRHAEDAVIVAAFVYHTANRDEKLPRKPLAGGPEDGDADEGRDGDCKSSAGSWELGVGVVDATVLRC